MRRVELEFLAKGVMAGNRASTARALTLVESELEVDREHSRLLMRTLWQERHRHKKQCRRIGFVGSPGAGKSSLIGAIGNRLAGGDRPAEDGHKVAVLCIDPSSPLSGGSILGDRVRMGAFAGNEEVFVRGMASGDDKGGLSRALTDASIICEAAGFGTILIETGGVGQSQTSVRELVHCLVMVVPPAGGDDLQAMKRGLLELVDIIVVSKYDGDFLSSVNRTFSDMQASSMMRGGSQKVLRTSVMEDKGLTELVTSFAVFFAEAGRQAQEEAQWQQWMDKDFTVLLQRAVFARQDFVGHYAKLRAEVGAGKVYAKEAAYQALEKLWANDNL